MVGSIPLPFAHCRYTINSLSSGLSMLSINPLSYVCHLGLRKIPLISQKTRGNEMPS